MAWPQNLVTLVALVDETLEFQRVSNVLLGCCVLLVILNYAMSNPSSREPSRTELWRCQT